MTTFEISHIHNGVNILEGLPFATCTCNRTICAVNCFTWKGQHLCDTCYSKHSEEREQTITAVEQHKPMKCTVCSTVKIGPDHRFYYHAHNVFESCCIEKMIQTGVDKEEICRTVDRFEPLCIECYDIVIHFENEWLDKFNHCRNKYLQKRYEAHTKDVYEQLREIMKEKDKHNALKLDRCATKLD